MIEIKDYITYDENDIPKDVLEAAIKFENIERNIVSGSKLFMGNAVKNLYESNDGVFNFNLYELHKKIKSNLKNTIDIIVPIHRIIKKDIEENSNYSDQIKINILKILK